MEVTTSDGATERRVLTAIITRTDFLVRLVGKLDDEPFRSKWSNLIYTWCIKHFLEYREAPVKLIESLFEDWCKGTNDKDQKKLVERFLSSLSGEYARQSEGINLAYSLDLAERHFNDVKLERLREGLQLRLEKGATEKGLEEVESFRRIELTSPPAIDLLRDKEAQRKALEEKPKVLIQYPGPAGEFFGSEFSEDSFIGVMAQAKGGKSYLLLDFAWHAMRQGKKVAYFQVGDLSQNQIMRRFLKRAVYRPLFPKLVRMPLSIVLPVGGSRELAIVDYQDKQYETEVSWKTAERAFAKIAARSKGDLRLAYRPVRTVSVLDIKAILERWDREGWVASCVIIDYAGNLAPVDYKASPVDQVSMSWMMMRQLSEIRKCCVITAQQSNKEGFSAWVLTRKHFSESKMILAHVTAFIGVNMTDEEKSRGIIRYNFLTRREEEFSETKCLYAASCLSVANPIVVSCLP